MTNSFGEKLQDYRDSQLNLTQNAFATALSESGLYKITGDDVAHWEANRSLERIDYPLYSLIAATLEKEAKTQNWGEEKITGMKRDLAASYKDRLKHAGGETNPFSDMLMKQREALGFSQEQFFQMLAEDKLSGKYIADVESGRAKPSLRFILATSQYFQAEMIIGEFERTEYVKSGMDSLSREAAAEEKSAEVKAAVSEAAPEAKGKTREISAFGHFLNNFQKEKGWSQSLLCGKIAKALERDSIDNATVSKVFNGHRLSTPKWLLEGAAKLPGMDKTLEELRSLAGKTVEIDVKYISTLGRRAR